jgi:hypothetical protein
MWSRVSCIGVAPSAQPPSCQLPPYQLPVGVPGDKLAAHGTKHIAYELDQVSIMSQIRFGTTLSVLGGEATQAGRGKGARSRPACRGLEASMLTAGMVTRRKSHACWHLKPPYTFKKSPAHVGVTCERAQALTSTCAGVDFTGASDTNVRR